MTGLTPSQAPSASPYLPNNSFPEQRYNPNQQNSGPAPAPGQGPGQGQVRYESMYPAPPPHNLPRAGPGMYEMPPHNHPYATRPDGENMPWGPDVSSACLPICYEHTDVISSVWTSAFPRFCIVSDRFWT